MSRYKGRASLKQNESKFPHHVDMMVSECGFEATRNRISNDRYRRGQAKTKTYSKNSS
jgi:hypothetical protein